LANWGSLYGRLKKLEENSPLTVQDPVVTKFFKDVVLQIPEPSEDSAPSTAATPAPIPKTEPASPMGSLTAIRSLTPALSLEQAHFHRLTTILSLGGFLSSGSDEDLLFRKGLNELSQQAGFREKAPEAFVDLLKTTKKNSDFHIYL